MAKDTIFKVNNLLNSGSIYNLLDKIILHNLVFPNTAYKLIGFAGYDGRSVMPILEQERICNGQPASQIMIDTYMSALGFTKENDEGRYSNGTYVVWDVVPRNVLVELTRKGQAPLCREAAEMDARPCCHLIIS